MKRIVVLLLSAFCALAQAQTWPAKPVRVIVPFAAGGATDLIARLLTTKLSENLGQQFFVENRGGAGGAVGSDLAAKAAPDGYTLIVGTVGTHGINFSLYDNPGFDPVKDFIGISRIAVLPSIILVNASLPAGNLRELVALAKASPGKIAYGSAGNLLYLTGAMLTHATGIEMLHVPFKGVGVAFPALLGGQVQMLLSDVVLALPHLKSGKLVGVVINQKSALLPDVPTLAEAGHPQLSFPGSFGIVARVGTPAAIVQRMNEEINSAMRSSAVAEKLEAAAFYPKFQTPAEYGTALQKAREYWAPFLKRHNISPE